MCNGLKAGLELTISVASPTRYSAIWITGACRSAPDLAQSKYVLENRRVRHKNQNFAPESTGIHENNGASNARSSFEHSISFRRSRLLQPQGASIDSDSRHDRGEDEVNESEPSLNHTAQCLDSSS
eukprot:6370367-Amphidinium_carterae.1